MPCSFLAFAGSLLQQSFKRFCLYIHIKCSPLSFVDERQQSLEINGIVKAGLRSCKDVTKQAGLFPKGTKHVDVVVRQISSGLFVKGRPVASLWQLDAALIGIFRKSR